MKQGDGTKVVIPGFGQFVAKHRPSREMRNPATGKMMMSKAKTSASFKPAAALKDL
jgi:nucleoid DNA-binding protein